MSAIIVQKKITYEAQDCDYKVEVQKIGHVEAV